MDAIFGIVQFVAYVGVVYCGLSFIVAILIAFIDGMGGRNG